MLKSKHNFTEKIALKFMANNEQYAAVWGLPPTHKGSKEQWIEISPKSIKGCEALSSPPGNVFFSGEGHRPKALRECSGNARRPFFRNFNCAY